MNELQLQGGPYRTTFVGLELLKPSTPQEWEGYGEVLRRVDEAKQWAIGDWLVDGKKHYGDRLYERAAGLLGLSDEGYLSKQKMLAEKFEIGNRFPNLSWKHHYEVASLKPIIEEEDEDGNLTGKLKLSEKETDYDKIDELLTIAEKEKLSVRELRTIVQEHKKDQDRRIALANEPEKYDVVYADPPWEYRNSGFEMSAANHYPTMPTHEIAGLKIPTADNAVCFMWVTNPLLEDGFAVLKGWGFEYKTCLVWVKDRHTAGFYVYGQHELLLIGVKGSGMTPLDDGKPKSIIYGDNRQHSRKPDQTYNIIEAMYPGARKLEMFARRTREGWEAYGNEV